ncbi:hypothetical protein FQA39_LY08226 [Lamprigera yunnana]|nr:hypothetical protein FQA39_LY08226 [Lamprigera yunnana]
MFIIKTIPRLKRKLLARGQFEASLVTVPVDRTENREPVNTSGLILAIVLGLFDNLNYFTMSNKKKVVHSQGRKIIYNVFQFIKEQKEPLKLTTPLYEAVATATGVGISTVKRICKEAKRKPKATLSMAASSSYLAWSSPSIPKITSENSPINVTVTKDEASWVASSFLLGAIPGCVFAGWAVEKFGPRLSLLLSFFPLFFPWIIVVFARSSLMLCIARFIAGSSFSIVTTSGSIYVGEISEKDIRGKLCTAFNVMKLTGSLFVLSIGPFVSFTVLAVSCSVIPVIFVVLFYFMPESPHYLIKIGDRDGARLSLTRLSSKNRSKSDIDDQLKDIESTVSFAMQNKSTYWEMLSKKEYRKSVIVIAGIKVIQQLTGYSAIEAYIQTIIESSGSSITPEISSIICGIVQLPAGSLLTSLEVTLPKLNNALKLSLVAAVIVDKLGRKPLLIISCIGCAVALIGEGVYFYLQDAVKEDVANISWLPTTGLILFLIMNPIGIFTLPYVLLGELFAANIKSVALSASTILGVTLGFLATKFFEPISVNLGLHSVFFMFASVCIFGALFVYFIQPETKGKSFQEIQIKLTRGKKEDPHALYVTTHF